MLTICFSSASNLIRGYSAQFQALRVNSCKMEHAKSCFFLRKRQQCCRVLSWFNSCVSGSELYKFFLIVIIYRQGRQLFHEAIRTPCTKSALNSVLLRLFATQIETNESRMMCKYAHLSQSCGETISRQNLSSFFAVFFVIFFTLQGISREVD